MLNKNLINQYHKMIVQSGYTYDKNGLGFYFDNGLKRFSIIKVGNLFQCYYNKNINGEWILQNRSNTMFEYSNCLNWIINLIQKN